MREGSGCEVDSHNATIALRARMNITQVWHVASKEERCGFNGFHMASTAWMASQANNFLPTRESYSHVQG